MIVEQEQGGRILLQGDRHARIPFALIRLLGIVDNPLPQIQQTLSAKFANNQF